MTEVTDTGKPEKGPAPGMALCLSGGGYRAMLFHLGALWRLGDVGYLPKLDRISSERRLAMGQSIGRVRLRRRISRTRS